MKMQRTTMTFKSWFGALEDAGCFQLRFGILILICIWSLVFYSTTLQISALYQDFEGAKNTHILQVLIWGFGEGWRFLIKVWHLNLDLDMSLTHPWCDFWLSVLILKEQILYMSLQFWFEALGDTGGSLYQFWRRKEQQFSGLLLSILIFWPLVHQCSDFLPSILILKVQRTSMSFKSSFGASDDAGGSWLWFGILILIWIYH